MSLRRYTCALVGFTSCLVTVAGGVAWATTKPADTAHRPGAARPRGRWQTVTYDGVSLRAPASWPVIRFAADPTACPRLDVHAVYLGTPGPHPLCPAGLVGRSEAVMVQPVGAVSGARGPGLPGQAGDAAIRLAGGQGLAGETVAASAVSRTISEVLPGPGARVTISYRSSPSVADAIRSSIRVSARGAARPARDGAAARAGRAARANHVVGARRAGRAGSAARPAAGLAAGQGIFQGGGFDTCAAPSAQTMTSWLSSSYRAVGIYIGGVNRACAQVNLSAGWLAGIVSQGWHYFPIYPGLQSSCVLASGDATITTSQAAQEGAAAADDAAAQAASLAIPKGTPLTYDMEAYGPSCNGQVLTFLSAWDSELHARGYRAGVYESFSNIGALAGAAGSITEPDIIYYADWDGDATTTSSYLPAGMWTDHARIHQYLGGHVETHGGASIEIDSDQLDVNLGGKAGPPPPGEGFRVSVAINANGTAEWFARSAGGTLTHAWQSPVGSLTWSAMHTLGRSPKTIVSNPAAAAQANGALTVFAVDSAGLIEHAWQQPGFPNGWEWGSPLPQLPVPALPGTDPAALLLPRGDVAVYQTSAGGGVLVTVQLHQDENADWATWGDIGGDCASSPVPVVDGAHKVQVFCVTAAGTAAMIRWNGRSWGSWSTLAGSPQDLAGDPSVQVNGEGQTEFFAATTAGGLAYGWQAGDRGGWTWGSPMTGSGLSVSGSVSAATWPAGQVIVYVRLSNGEPAFARQAGQAGSDPFSTWSTIGGVSGGPILGGPAGWLNRSGAAGVAVLEAGHVLVVASDSGAGWSAWTQVGIGF
ncbi:MAG TPA: glycoside hydrolase domain-containing protein [Streptosporangiaceae bacterium]|nr:glycoside hydrolase domain-containing protein [Streptosporangiaceae bacterium]